jgi:outer membrane protein assembly factor BamA
LGQESTQPVEGEATQPVEGEAADEESRFNWYVLPNVAYDTDDGLGFGARAEIAVNEEGYEPYRVAYVVHAFASLRNYHHHRFRFDRVGLGRNHRLRLTLHVAYRQWGNDGYWGIGNGTTVEREFAGDYDRDDLRRKRYRYNLIQPFAHLTLRADQGRNLQLFVSVNAKYSWVRTYSGSLLEEHRPYGMDGGLTVLVAAGLLYDSRRPEVDPRQGILAEASGQWALPLPWGPGNFGGVFLSLRAYRGVTDWLVLAGRIMAEMLAGEVPFYEMVHWRGAIPIAGFGGFETLRGISFGRWRAPSKAVLNLEARFKVLQHPLFHRPIVWQLALFGDAGLVWGAGDAATASAPDFPLHITGGLGIRAVYAESFVARIDVGLGADAVAEADVAITQELSWGLYIVFDHAF